MEVKPFAAGIRDHFIALVSIFQRNVIVSYNHAEQGDWKFKSKLQGFL